MASHPKLIAAGLLTLACALVLCGCRDATLISSSMTPSIKRGEKVIVDYTAYAVGAPKRWDVVAFEPPGRTNEVWVMRIIALPGETIAFAKGGIAIGGQPLSLPPHITNVTYVSLDRLQLPSSVASPYLVPLDSFFVLGDNSAHANDSRFWGAVPRTNIVGKVRDK